MALLAPTGPVKIGYEKDGRLYNVLDYVFQYRTTLPNFHF